MDPNSTKRKTNMFFLEDYLDMTITQVFTLIIVNSFPAGVIRYTILQSLNTLFSPHNRISASSFYHSLEKLEKQGLIEFIRDEKGKISLVRGTKKSSEALNHIGHINVMSGVNIGKIIADFSIKILEFIGLESQEDRGLIISKDLSLDLHLYPFIEQYVKNIHCLSSNTDFNRYIVPYSEKINQTTVINKKIREPNDEFNVTFLPTYYPTEDFFGMNDDEFWQEVVRVTKPGGLIITLSFREMVKQDNFLLDGIIDQFSTNPMIGFTTKEKIKHSMLKARINEVNIADFQGILLAVGRKEKLPNRNFQ